jgi:hypothetical protein
MAWVNAQTRRNKQQRRKGTRKAKVRQAGRGRIAGLQDYRVVDNSGHVEPIADPILKPEPPQ